MKSEGVRTDFLISARGEKGGIDFRGLTDAANGV
jgi:hypothetical protein